VGVIAGEALFLVCLGVGKGFEFALGHLQAVLLKGMFQSKSKGIAFDGFWQREIQVSATGEAGAQHDDPTEPDGFQNREHPVIGSGVIVWMVRTAPVNVDHPVGGFLVRAYPNKLVRILPLPPEIAGFQGIAVLCMPLGFLSCSWSWSIDELPAVGKYLAETLPQRIRWK
jgi:hypothetical protein